MHRFLPEGVMPYRLLRDGSPIAFYDATAPLSIGLDGDVLECIDDAPDGPMIELASMAGVTLRLRDLRLDALAWAHGIGLAQLHDPAA